MQHTTFYPNGYPGGTGSFKSAGDRCPSQESYENRFVQMVMDMDVKERNKGLAKKRKLLSEGEKRITELDMIFKRLYEDNISGKLTDERFHKLSTDYEAEQAGLQTQAAILREEIEEVEAKVPMLTGFCPLSASTPISRS